jgi:hypothetical protein
MRCGSLRNHGLILLALVGLLFVSSAALVAQDSHLTPFERDCPACRVSSIFVGEVCAQLELTPPVYVAWTPLPEEMIEQGRPVLVTRGTRAPPR